MYHLAEDRGMTIEVKSIKGAVFIGSVVVALIGFIISTTRDAVQVTNTLERVNETQQTILETNAIQHEKFDSRLFSVEIWKARKEGEEDGRRYAEEDDQ